LRSALETGKAFATANLRFSLECFTGLLADQLCQSARQYSTEAPKGKSLAPVYLTVGLAGLGVGLYRYQSSAATAETPKERSKVFTGGDQGWVGLKLANTEILSHNTKRLRFEFEDKEAVSGLHVACEFSGRVYYCNY
jgi:cytochrome-b5 reductase